MDNRLQENLNRTQQNYIAPFLWLHNEDDAYIVAEIERIYECGIRSVCLESRTHEEFCRGDWWSDVSLIFDECRKRNMQVWILDDKHFPTGYANGIFEEKYKELRSFDITETHIDVVGPVKDGSAMASCWLGSENDEIIRISALKHIPNTDGYSEIIDITDGISGDMVYFDLPEGMWRIVFMIKTQRGKGGHLAAYCDMLNPKMIDLFIEEVYQPHYDRFSAYFGNTFLGFFSDEPGFMNGTSVCFSQDTGVPFVHHPWHDSLNQYPEMENMAGLWFDIEGISEEMRYFYMDTITKKYQENFVDKIGKWCRDHGVMYIGHIIEDNHSHAKTGFSAGHYFRALNGQDMSGVDVVLHQIVPGLTECRNAGSVCYKHMENDFFHYYLAKLASSFAHMDPLKKGRAMCEIFGAYGWAEGTKIMKYLMDHMLVRGINYFVPHAFSPKPNDTDCPPNFYDTGKNPQFKFFGKHMDYMNRMCYMLSDGKHVSTCAILYDAENHWVNQKFLPLEKIAKVLYDNLLDYDIIPADYLDKIENGALNGEKYPVLIVPYAENIPDKIMEKLKKADIKVITVSEQEAETKFENVKLSALADYMQDNGYRDIKADNSGSFLRYYHYVRNGAHIVMFSNEDINHTIKTKVKISAFSGGKYIEYDAFLNEAVVKESDDRIELTLSPYHARVILFGDVDFDGIPADRPIQPTQETVLRLNYKISIARRNSEEFVPYKTTDRLLNITGRQELPDFSGHIRYETEFEGKNGKYLLDLGYVGEVAELYINDCFVGEKLFPPYEFDISEFIKDGKNKMTVVVSNHNGFAVKDEFSKYLLFEPSGLLGDVKLIQF